MFENIGYNDIYSTDYDKNIDFGIKVKNGIVVDIVDFKSNSDYIKINMKPKIKNKNTLIKFNKINIEESKKFEISFIVLKNIDKPIYLTMNGYISGIKEETLTIQEQDRVHKDNLYLAFVYEYKYYSLIIFVIIPFIIQIALIYLFILTQNWLVNYKKNKIRELRYVYFGKGIDYDLKKLETKFGSVIRFSDIACSAKIMDKTNAMRCFFANFENIEQFAKLKYLYDKNIKNYIELSNEINILETELLSRNMMIDEYSKKIKVTQNMTLYEIPTYLSYYHKLKEVRLYSDKKKEYEESDYKYKVYEKLLTKEFKELLFKKDHISKELNILYDKLLELKLISSYKDLELIISKHIILKKDINNEIVEEKSFISMLDDLIDYFKIEVDFIKIESELKKNQSQYKNDKYNSQMFFNDFY